MAANSSPRVLPPLAVQSRWYSEPVRSLFIPRTSFIPNKQGFNVLSKTHQAFIAKFVRLKNPPWILLADADPIPGFQNLDSSAQSPYDSLSSSKVFDTSNGGTALSPTRAGSELQPAQKEKWLLDPTPHLSYLIYLRRNQPPKTPLEIFGSAYQDYLQAPLQPLTDNLESITYEVFEKDPIKYAWYERAITRALEDWAAEKKPTSSSTGEVVIAVVGAGRGPLVTGALRASCASGVPVKVCAVEKNPNAFVVLQRHNIGKWGGIVQVYKGDMRSWKGPVLSVDEKMNSKLPNYGHVDILVSELLGSFADNELSPECLDGVQRVLNPKYGISIPSSYKAFLTPIAAPKLYSDISDKNLNRESNAFETPWVVMLHAVDFLAMAKPQSYVWSTENGQDEFKMMGNWKDETDKTRVPMPDVQKVWSFTHPIPGSILENSNLLRTGDDNGGFHGSLTCGDETNEHNTRYKRMTFLCGERGVCHGLAGYFEAVLYKGVELSTNPVTMSEKSADMISWFPIFFPLKEPIYLPKNTELDVTMWRMTGDRKVWYEWMVESFAWIEGSRMALSVSSLHSSRGNGCFM